MTRQHPAEENRNGAAAAAALPTIRAKHPLSAQDFARRVVQVISKKPAVGVEGSSFAAMRTGALLEAKAAAL